MALVACHDIDLVTLDLARKRRLRLHRHDARAQWRGHAVLIIFIQTNSCPICSLERFRPIKYRHKIHTPNG